MDKQTRDRINKLLTNMRTTLNETHASLDRLDLTLTELQREYRQKNIRRFWR